MMNAAVEKVMETFLQARLGWNEVLRIGNIATDFYRGKPVSREKIVHAG